MIEKLIGKYFSFNDFDRDGAFYEFTDVVLKVDVGDLKAGTFLSTVTLDFSEGYICFYFGKLKSYFI